MTAGWPGPVMIAAVGALALASGCRGESERVAHGPDTIPIPNDLDRFAGTRVLQAVTRAREQVAADPGSATAWGHLGHVYMVHGQQWLEEAAQCYERAGQIAPSEFRWPYFLGRACSEHDPGKAAHAFDRALAMNPNYAPAQWEYAKVLARLGRADDARHHFERLAELEPQHPAAYMGLAKMALAAKQYQSARDQLQRVLDLNPREGQAHYALAQVYRALGDRKSAAHHLREAKNARSLLPPMDDPLWRDVAMAGMTAEHCLERGMALAEAGNYHGAVAELEAAVAQQKKFPPMWLYYGAALAAVGKHKEAVAALNTALATTEDPVVRRRMMQSRRERGQPEEITPLQVSIHVKLAEVYMKDNKPNLAEAPLQKALALDANSVAANINLARAYYLQGKRDDAIAVLRKARRARPEPRILGMLAALLREAGDAAAARAIEEDLRRLRQPPTRNPGVNQWQPRGRDQL